jgi:hypothetical protein
MSLGRAARRELEASSNGEQWLHNAVPPHPRTQRPVCAAAWLHKTSNTWSAQHGSSIGYDPCVCCYAWPPGGLSEAPLVPGPPASDDGQSSSGGGSVAAAATRGGGGGPALASSSTSSAMEVEIARQRAQVRQRKIERGKTWAHGQACS